MRYKQFGRTGVRVSPFCIGTGNFGRYVGEADSVRVMRMAVDEGINFIDTADIYNDGVSEDYVGRALEGIRDKVFLATKAHSPVGDGPNDWGSSRRHIMEQIEKSLQRLRTDHVDLYQMHQFDTTMPQDETLRALDDLVRQGKVRYIGSSNYPAWRMVESFWTSDRLHLNRYVSEQSQYNIFRRRPEDEQIRVAREYGGAFMGYSPLAAGWLSGKFSKGKALFEDGTKSKDHVGGRLDTPQGERWIDAIDRLMTIASDKGCSLPQFALAWAMRDPVVVPILGPRTEEHIRTGIDALDVMITAEDERRVDEIAAPATNTV